MRVCCGLCHRIGRDIACDETTCLILLSVRGEHLTGVVRQVTKLEAQSSKQQALIAELQAAVRRAAEERDTAARQLKERLAHAHAELAAARLTISKLKSDFLEQTSLLGASATLPAAASPAALDRAVLDTLTGVSRATSPGSTPQPRAVWASPPGQLFCMAVPAHTAAA